MAKRTLPSSTPKRAVIYLRQSLDSTGEGLAVARQRKDCAKLCADRGYMVVNTYNDNDRSASGRRRRPGFEEMLVAARAGEFDVIVGWHLDRLTRTLKDYLPLLELAEKHGVAITTVSGDIDLTNDMGQTVAGLLAVVASSEIKRKGARQSRANLQRAEEGRASIGGPPKLGYVRDPRGEHDDRHTGRFVLDRGQAKVVRQAYADLLAGRSLRAITATINEAGYLNSHGKPWGRTGVKALLANPRNAGLREYQGEIMPETGAWPAIVSQADWRAAKALLSDPARKTNGSFTGGRKWIGSGLYLCGLCGHTLLSNYREQTSTGEKVRVYYCPEGGKHLSRRADVVDEFVEDAVVERLSRKDAVKLLIDHDAPDTAKLTAESERISRRLEAAAIGFAQDDAMTPGMLSAATRTLRARLAEIEERMSHHSRASVLRDIVGADDVLATWKGYPLDRQRAILSAIGTVTVQKARPGGNSRTMRRVLPEGSVVVDFVG